MLTATTHLAQGGTMTRRRILLWFTAAMLFVLTPTFELAQCCLSGSGCFCNTGDGTTRDTCTGLQWEKKKTAYGSGANPADLHDVDNLYVWAGCCSQACYPATDYCQPNEAAAATCLAQ